jgi:hypothetical protein
VSDLRAGAGRAQVTYAPIRRATDDVGNEDVAVPIQRNHAGAVVADNTLAVISSAREQRMCAEVLSDGDVGDGVDNGYRRRASIASSAPPAQRTVRYDS